MHISEGVLTAPVLAGGAALAAAGVAVGLRRLDSARLPRTALLAAAFFVANLIHVPIGPVSAHLVLNGLLGLLLGWAAFPALLVALALQAVLFQFGGLLVLGVNTFNMALPAVLLGLAAGPFLGRGNGSRAVVVGFVVGAGGVLGAAILTALSLYLSGEAFATVAQAIVVAHLPIMAVEGVITGFTAGFLGKVRPEMLRPEPA